MKTITTASRFCGFCETGTHVYCPGAVRNGDGSLLICPCSQEGCGQDKVYCKTCGHRRADEVQDWKCLDQDECQARHQYALEKSQVRLFGRPLVVLGDPEAPAARARAPRPEKAPSVARECTCSCGGQTKGGKFLPGHDSRYLSVLVADPGTESRERAYGISEAFGKKYDKRVSG